MPLLPVLLVGGLLYWAWSSWHDHAMTSSSSTSSHDGGHVVDPRILAEYAPLFGWPSYQHAMPGRWEFFDATEASVFVPPSAFDVPIPALELVKFAHDSGFDVWAGGTAGAKIAFIAKPDSVFIGDDPNGQYLRTVGAGDSWA